MTKTCLICNETKPVEKFKKQKNKELRLNQCRTCIGKKNQKYINNNPVKKAKRRIRALKKQTGLDPNFSYKNFDELLKNQNGLCKICKTKPYNKALSIDHDHITGKVRGLLCISCNTGLGCFRDNVDIMLAAIKYITNK